MQREHWVNFKVFGTLILTLVFMFIVMAFVSRHIAGRRTGEHLMYYAIWACDNTDSLDNRLRARPDHLARLQELRDQGRLLTAGPLPAIDSEDPGTSGFTGSLIVAEFESLDAAETWAGADPYAAAGVYHRVDVRPFKKVF